MLLAHGDASAGFTDLFATARTHGPLVCLDLGESELTEFIDALEQTANSAQNVEARERLGFAFARVETGSPETIEFG